LYGKNLALKEALNMGLEFLKVLKNFGFVFDKVNPSKFAKIVNKTHIILEPANGFGRRASYI
jgi:hypothetical protein